MSDINNMDWVEHHLNIFRTGLVSDGTVEMKQVAAWGYIVDFINNFMMLRKNMTLEDLEQVMIAYGAYLEELKK